MKLAAKLVTLLLVGMIAVVALEAWISVQRDVRLFDDDMRSDAKQLVRTLKVLTEDVWRSSGKDRAMQLIHDADEQALPGGVNVVPLGSVRPDVVQERSAAAGAPVAVAGQPISIVKRSATGQGFLYTYLPLDVDAETPVAIELARPLDSLDRFRRQTVTRACIVSSVFVVGSGLAIIVLGFLLVGRPLNQLIELTRRIGRGDPIGVLPAMHRDELGELTQSLYAMCEQLGEARERLQRETEARIATLEQLRHADRLTTVGRLASGLAHELGTPMNVVSARAGMIVDERPSSTVIEHAQIVKAQIEKMSRIIRQLLDFARQRRPHKSRQNLQRLVAQTVDLLDALARGQSVQLVLAPAAEPVEAEVDEGQIQQVITNLLVNAIQAMPQGGRVELRLDRVMAIPPDRPDRAPSAWARIEVRDEGVGISSEILSQVFDPFFTTKDIGQGSGLGLSIAYGIVGEHEGWIDVASQEGQGSCFQVYLPV